MFELTLETQGLQPVLEVMEALHELGAKPSAVELNSVSRSDSDQTNAEILRYLADQGRDFIASSNQDADQIAKAFSDELERRLGDKFSKEVFWDNWGTAKSSTKSAKALANVLSAAAFRAAMMKYMEQVADRIDSQHTNNPPFKAELTDAYAAKKLREFGFTKPIGKASAQLLDNLNPDGLGARNIRLKKS